LLNLAYNYGARNDGEIATITDHLDATRSASYTYDAWSRLSTAKAEDIISRCRNTLHALAK
jgi:hypothetical protein